MVSLMQQLAQTSTDLVMYLAGFVAMLLIFLSTILDRLNLGFDWSGKHASRKNLVRVLSGLGSIGMLVLVFWLF